MPPFGPILLSIITFILPAMSQTVLQVPDAPPSHLARSTSNVASPSYSARLYVASYDESITTFTLRQSDSAISLIASPPNKDAGANPTWLDLDRTGRKLFCLNEQIESSQGSASIAEYDIKDDGSLALAKKVGTPPGGPVQSKYLPLGKTGEGIHVIAHYRFEFTLSDFCALLIYSSPGTFTAFDQDFKQISRINLAIGPSGPTKRQQEGVSNGHGVITHPRLGTKVLVPDLSQDKVWVIDCSAQSCNNTSSLTVPPGTGPRHGTIWEDDNALYLYVVGEISNMIEGYKINISNKGLTFDHVSTTSATQTPVKEGYAAAEILVSVSLTYFALSLAKD
jgi:6-phosphogluconolactonase (cycloisomerase 2 family)